MCHVLGSMAEGTDADTLGGPSKKQIEDLGRCVNPAQPSLLNVTSDLRVVHRIESAVVQRANCDPDLREHHPGSTKDRLMTWRAEAWNILGVFDVRDSQFALATVSKPPQGDLDISEIDQRVHGSVVAEPPMSVLSTGEYSRLM